MESQVCVFNQTRQSFLSLKVKVAESYLTRLLGLLGKGRMRPDEGLLIRDCKAIHTIGMRFSIDLLYLDKGNRVLAMFENLPPFRISPLYRNASALLELPVRTIFESETQIGDKLIVASAEDMRGLLEEGTRWNLGVVDGAKLG